MPEVRLPTEVHRRKPPLRKRALETLGWLGFVGGGLVTPRLAAKAAARIWCKLPDNAGRRKDNRPWPGRLEMLDAGLASPVAVEIWEPGSGPQGQGGGPGGAAAAGSGGAAAGAEPKTVWLMHGWGGWRGQVAAFVEPLTAAGFRVVGADALSHGDSGPGMHGARFSTGGELMRTFDALVKVLGQPHGVIAHSLGCAAACRSILNGKLAVERLTLVSPSPDMVKVAQTFARNLGFGKRAHRLLVEEMSQRAQGSLGDFDIAAMGATGLLPDALVIHDAADRESPYQVAQAIAASWPAARLVTTQGLGHHRILIDPAVVAQAAANMAA
ncbi:MAG: alpha/beta hydrolase [Bifidobacteriaceae bacterium]|jgi:pimeloyl-ACP methyl ester carboxylesterase|nr:alpha/beta hydrolase [Bifidobacteriaceae bacterium]